MARKQQSSSSSSSTQQQKPPPKRRTGSTSDGTTATKTTTTTTTNTSPHYRWKTILRESIIPFLPPPITKAIYEFDKTYYIQFGPEASITIGSTSIVGLIVWILILVKGRQLLFGTNSKSYRRALVDDDNNNINNTKFLDTSTATTVGDTELPCKATVILCGPVYSGKTRMFYQLCNYGSSNSTMYSNIPTLSSIKVNVGTGIDSIILTETNATSNDNTGSKQQQKYRIEYIRYVDWPGRATLDDVNFVSVITEEATTTLRIIFVIDSTKSITSSALVFYELLDIIHQRYQCKHKSTNSKSANNNDLLLTILIACHKKDLSKSKNHRRIKIQMRTELEKLLTIQYKTIETDTNQKEHNDQLQQQSKNTSTLNSTTITTTKQPWWQQGKVLDLDNLQFCKLRFISTTCCTIDDKGMNELARYCSNGL